MTYVVGEITGKNCPDCFPVKLVETLDGELQCGNCERVFGGE